MIMSHIPKNTLREIFERMLYLVSLLGLCVSITVLCFSLEIFFICFELLALIFILASSMLLLLNIEFRNFGIRKLHFKEHENSLNSSLEQEDLDTGFEGSKDMRLLKELEKLIALIEESSGWERQDNRATAKAWLSENRKSLDPASLKLVEENLWYL